MFKKTLTEDTGPVENVKADPTSKFVFTQNGTVSDKLQKAGYRILAIKMLTIFGEMEWKLEGDIALEVEVLNREIKKSHKSGKMKLFVADDLAMIYNTEKPKSPDLMTVEANIEAAKKAREKASKRK